MEEVVAGVAGQTEFRKDGDGRPLLARLAQQLKRSFGVGGRVGEGQDRHTGGDADETVMRHHNSLRFPLILSDKCSKTMSLPMSKPRPSRRREKADEEAIFGDQTPWKNPGAVYGW